MRRSNAGLPSKVVRQTTRLNAILGSDIGHWDVTDMTKVLVEAFELVDDGYLDANDFRDFSYANVVRMHTGMNPDFFTGTVVEDSRPRPRRSRRRSAV